MANEPNKEADEKRIVTEKALIMDLLAGTAYHKPANKDEDRLRLMSKVDTGAFVAHVWKKYLFGVSGYLIYLALSTCG